MISTPPKAHQAGLFRAVDYLGARTDHCTGVGEKNSAELAVGAPSRRGRRDVRARRGCSSPVA
jgi:hypothetical protein